jgi:tripeptidyl-peptidase-1
MTQYKIYIHATSKGSLACEEYSVSAHIQEHADFITPTVHFDPMVELKARRTDLQGCSLR